MPSKAGIEHLLQLLNYSLPSASALLLLSEVDDVLEVASASSLIVLVCLLRTSAIASCAATKLKSMRFVDFNFGLCDLVVADELDVLVAGTLTSAGAMTLHLDIMDFVDILQGDRDDLHRGDRLIG